MFTRYLFGLAGYVCLIGGVASAQPWSTPFSKDITAIRQAASEIKTPEKDGVHVLLDEQRFVIDAAGRVTHTMRLVYRVVHEDYVETWSTLAQAFEPWHQAKPQLRARSSRPMDQHFCWTRKPSPKRRSPNTIPACTRTAVSSARRCLPSNLELSSKPK
jgi:hypothetical protein